MTMRMIKDGLTRFLLTGGEQVKEVLKPKKIENPVYVKQHTPSPDERKSVYATKQRLGTKSLTKAFMEKNVPQPTSKTPDKAEKKLMPLKLKGD